MFKSNNFRTELKFIGKLFFIHSVSELFESLLPHFMTFISIMVFACVSNKIILANYVILLVSYFRDVCWSIGNTFTSLEYAIGAVISLKRFQVRSGSIFR
jgi:hypothetical protein